MADSSPRRVSLLPPGLKHEGPDDAVGMLLACHDRIRSFCQLAVRVAEVDGVEPVQLVEATASLHRYFTVALPLHIADEEIGLRPRLVELSERSEVLAALAQMTDQHEAIEAQLAELVPVWGRIAQVPGDRALLRSTTEAARMLGRAMGEHLALEERALFPLVRGALPIAVQQEFHDEIRRRRAASAAPPRHSPLVQLLLADHQHLEALLHSSAAIADASVPSCYEELREGLLRHIGIEEKLLLPACRRRRGAAHPLARQLRLDHAALAALLVPTPTEPILGKLRGLLRAHDLIEEGPGGLYETCAALLREEEPRLVERMKAVAAIPLAPHHDGPRSLDAVERLFRSAGRVARTAPVDRGDHSALATGTSVR